MSDDDVHANKSSVRALQCSHSLAKLFRIHLASGLTLPIVSAGFEAQEKRFEPGSHHHPCDLRGNKSGIQSVQCMERKTQTSFHHFIQKRKQDAVRPEQQRVVIESDMASTETSKIFEFCEAIVQRPCGEIWKYQRHRT